MIKIKNFTQSKMPKHPPPLSFIYRGLFSLSRNYNLKFQKLSVTKQPKQPPPPPPKHTYKIFLFTTRLHPPPHPCLFWGRFEINLLLLWFKYSKTLLWFNWWIKLNFDKNWKVITHTIHCTLYYTMNHMKPYHTILHDTHTIPYHI